MAATARKLERQRENEYERKLRVIEGRRRTRKLNAINYGMFLVVSVAILALVIVYYLSLQSDITNSIKDISKMENRLNELRLDNDENYSRITSNVNLEEIRKTAIQELGMRYAEEGQIITFNGEGSDYLRQTGKIPE